MEKKTYNRFNFHKHTFCEFIEQDIASISALQIHYKSKSGSSYSYTEEGVYRSSNHWGRASNCRWRLVSSSSSKINNFKNRVGFAKWSDFYPNNETEKLFYIEVNFENNEVQFQHKENPTYDGNAVLRNASETAKIIRQIKELLISDNWSKHYNFVAIDEVRINTIHALINTTIPLNKLKMDWK